MSVIIVMIYINRRETSPLIRYLGLMVLAIGCNACMNSNDFNLQGDVDTLGDAISHCRAYTTPEMPPGTRIALDEFSSRETHEYYDIYFDVSDSSQSGYAKCRVDKSGLITYLGTRDFHRKSKSFASF